MPPIWSRYKQPHTEFLKQTTNAHKQATGEKESHSNQDHFVENSDHDYFHTSGNKRFTSPVISVKGLTIFL